MTTVSARDMGYTGAQPGWRLAGAVSPGSRLWSPATHTTAHEREHVDDLDQNFLLSSTLRAQAAAQRILTATIRAQTEAQRLLAAQVAARRKAERVLWPFPPRSGPASRLAQGLAPSPQSVPQLSAAPLLRVGGRRGRQPGSTHVPKLRNFVTEYPRAWYKLKERLGRLPHREEMAWELDRIHVRTLKRHLDRHPNLRKQFPLSRKRR